MGFSINGRPPVSLIHSFIFLRTDLRIRHNRTLIKPSCLAKSPSGNITFVYLLLNPRFCPFPSRRITLFVSLFVTVLCPESQACPSRRPVVYYVWTNCRFGRKGRGGLMGKLWALCIAFSMRCRQTLSCATILG